ncbi:MAG TPA: CoA pyrophosphatase [Bacteroidia bacterium]|jgi:8-oxo-dGTP pyrophosphatase MutT (NUDIX family)|nr:CoA pyrophosphatase [Bacteroidia bacterium]
MHPFIEQLKVKLTEPLPGQAAQFLMVPGEIAQLKNKYAQPLNHQPKKSAVLILLYPLENGISTVLIERAVYVGVHSGQIAFPGGKAEETDPDLKYTALRETYEEIGIPMEKIEVLGNLTDVYINPSNYLVTPYIGYYSGSPDFIPNEREVQRIITIDILDPVNVIKSEKKIMHSNGLSIYTPFYNVNGFTIWGATAMIMSELIALTEGIRNQGIA